VSAKERARKAARQSTLARLRAEISELRTKLQRNPETALASDEDTLEALEAWERQIAFWDARM
jgi:Skp family chaperone for outer membrane proteins